MQDTWLKTFLFSYEWEKIMYKTFIFEDGNIYF